MDETSSELLIQGKTKNIERQRFNPSAVKFLEQVFTSLLTYSKAIYLSGSSFMFASAYQRSGGSSHTAGVKVQLEYDLLSGQFLQVHSGPGKQNDKTYGSTCLQTVETGELWVLVPI